ncbi:MAG: prepilin peptidase [Actinobacteria bacterium]|nr:prepilin peptidase [Actinomycetota bacterium]
MSNSILILGCGLAGLIVGVFVDVLVVRGPGKRSFAPPWTRCTTCDRSPMRAGLIPVAGTFVMGGRCGACGEELGWWQPVVEVANAVLWMLAAVRFGWNLELIAILPFFSGLLALSVIDFRTYRLPDRIDTPLLVGSIPLIVVVSLVQHRPHDLLWAAIGAVGYWLLLALMWLIHPRGMGYGDVKFARVLGLFLGWTHPVLILYGLMFAGVAGSVIGIGMLVATRDRTKGFPFGPWLAGGCVVAILISERLTRNF